tara:strand:- start:25 stop:210 length:186 start_codon:yes stop_codon:yes gene_type:complete
MNLNSLIESLVITAEDRQALQNANPLNGSCENDHSEFCEDCADAIEQHEADDDNFDPSAYC